MKLLDRYIIKRFFTTLFLMLSIVTLLVILIHSTENANAFRKHNLSFKQIFDYYCVLLPFMANFLAPIIVFSTTIWVTTRLTQRSEVIAILSSGVSFHRLAAPYLFIGLMLTGLNFYLTGWLLADANKARVAFEVEYLGFDMDFSNKSNGIYLKVGGEQYLYLAKYYGYNNTGYNVYLDTIKNGALIESIYAEKMRWNKTAQAWEFLFWKKRILFPKHEELQEGYSFQLPLPIDPEDFSINPSLKEGLTLGELALHIQKLLHKGDETARFFIAEKYIRYMTPFAIIILVVLGFLVSVRKPRGGISRQITLGFVLACLYMIMFLSAKTVVETQSEHPLLSIWMPNIMFTFLCLVFYRLVSK